MCIFLDFKDACSSQLNKEVIRELVNLSCGDSYDEIVESSQRVVVSELFAEDVLEFVVSLLEISQLKILLVVIKAL